MAQTLAQMRSRQVFLPFLPFLPKCATDEPWQALLLPLHEMAWQMYRGALAGGRLDRRGAHRRIRRSGASRRGA